MSSDFYMACADCGSDNIIAVGDSYDTLHLVCFDCDSDCLIKINR